MVAEVKVRIESRELLAALARLKMSLPLGGDMSPAMRSLARVLKTGTQLRFRSARGPDGEAWPRSRRASEAGGQTLSLSRRLRNSITSASTSTSTTASVGTNVIYAAIHQFGGVIRATKGPFPAIPRIGVLNTPAQSTSGPVPSRQGPEAHQRQLDPPRSGRVARFAELRAQVRGRCGHPHVASDSGFTLMP